MKLSIDTSKIKQATVSIGIFTKTAADVLPLIEEGLRFNTITLTDITEIEVAIGPGSFTGLRVGATVANALGFLLDIPVNGKKTLVIPTY